MGFSDASLEGLLSVSGLYINHVMTPSDAFDPESPLMEPQGFTDRFLERSMTSVPSKKILH